MTQSLKTEFEAGADEADYFSAILALQNAAPHNNSLPQALLEEIQTLEAAFKTEGLNCQWRKPIPLAVADLAALDACENLTIFYKQTDVAQTIIAVQPNAIVSLAALLLGGKPTLSVRVPSRIERQIAARFFETTDPNFKPIDASQKSIIWADFVGANVLFDEAENSPFLTVLINRRGENASSSQAMPPNIQHQNYLQQALGHGVLNVDYVLDGGQIPLALLHNLDVGTLLPLTSLSDEPLVARANGEAIFSGVLNLTSDQMLFNVTRILAESRND
jgi:flagellar motor switch protein FliM